jgi:hypothetical protein
MCTIRHTDDGLFEVLLVDCGFVLGNEGHGVGSVVMVIVGVGLSD